MTHDCFLTLTPDPGSAGMTVHPVMPDLIRHPDVDEQ
jgi:hypothetical protein